MAIYVVSHWLFGGTFPMRHAKTRELAILRISQYVFIGLSENIGCKVSSLSIGSS